MPRRPSRRRYLAERAVRACNRQQPLRQRPCAVDGAITNPVFLVIFCGALALIAAAQLPEEHPEGYRGSRPVRIGNAAARQLQLDIYGELIDSVYLYNKYGTPTHHAPWQDLLRIVEWICEHWDQADEGIWETRGGRRDFVFSRPMSWVAVERATRIARQRGLPGSILAWGPARDAIYDQIMARGFHDDRRAFVQRYDTDVLDASILLMPLVKFIAPTDPRWLSTLGAISDDLVSDSLVYR